jgi:glutamate synthase (NADPH/NADH) small chain
MVLIAMGFLGSEDTLFKELPIARDGRSNVLTHSCGYETSQPGIFTAGDMRRGQSLVVWAIQEGRRAARACDVYLMGRSFLAE